MGVFPCSCANRQAYVRLIHRLAGNLRLQEMMEIMAKERNGRVCAMDHRYCIDNGAMIAQAGVLQFQYGDATPLTDATCSQRYVDDCALRFGTTSNNVRVDSALTKYRSFGATTDRAARSRASNGGGPARSCVVVNCQNARSVVKIELFRRRRADIASEICWSNQSCILLVPVSPI